MIEAGSSPAQALEGVSITHVVTGKIQSSTAV
jgi:hypothetical protein